jgi:hypothetical protein
MASAVAVSHKDLKWHLSRFAFTEMIGNIPI